MSTRKELNTWRGITLGLAIALSAAIAAGVIAAARLTIPPQNTACSAPVATAQANSTTLTQSPAARHAIERYWL